MSVDIGPKIGIDGEQQFRRQITEINQSLKTMAAEQKAVASAFDDEANAEKKATSQKEVLNRQIEAQKKKLELLEKGLKDSTQVYGEADTKTQKWQQAVYEATTTLSGMEKELKDVDRGVDSAAESMEDASEAANDWADVMVGQLLADGVKAGLSKMADLIKGAASALWDASKAGAAYADDIITMASTTGLSTQKLQEYKYMADLTDVSLETITGSMTKMEKKMAGAKEGTGAAAEAWKKLGVNITNADGELRSSEEIFNDTVAALKDIKNESERDAIAMTLMGTSAKDLNPLITAGKDELEKLAKQAHDTGYVLSGEALEALGKQQNAMDTLNKKVEAVGNKFAVGLAPGIETFYTTINNAMDNPKTERALNVLSTGIGTFVSGLANLATDVLPAVVSAFSIFDSRLATYSDDQIDRLNQMESMQSSWAGMKKTFGEDAAAIWEEHNKAEALLKQLQAITDEDGNVTEANQEMAEYIANELNKALGTNIEVIDGVVQGWKDVQTEVEAAIQKQTAMSLMSAMADEYAYAMANAATAGQNAATAKRDLDAALEEQKAARQAVQDLVDYADAEQAALEGNLKLHEQYNQAVAALALVDEKVVALQEDYDSFSATAEELTATTSNYSKALKAQAEGDYQAVIDYTTKGYSLERDYIANKAEFDQQKLKDLKKNYADQQAYIEWYEGQLAAKKDGFNKADLAAAKKHLDDIGATIRQARRDMLNDQSALMKEEGVKDGKAYGDGIVQGLNNKTGPVYNAAMGLAGSISRATRATLQIQSPSRVGAYIGEMWDKGLIKGIEGYEAQVELAASGLAKTVADASAPSTDGLAFHYGNARTTAGVGFLSSSTTNTTTNMGGITVQVDSPGVTDVELLAEKIMEKLTNVLNRAQRGGRV